MREPNDAYPTPAWCVARLLEAIPSVVEEVREGLPVLEPCAGDGAILRRIIAAAGGEITWSAVELREECRPALAALDADCPGAYAIGDYLELGGAARPWLAITNPPFSLAQEITTRMLETSQRHVIVLQRLNWLASSARREWWAASPLAAVYVLSQRPAFVGGRTDSADYAWYHWDRSHQGPPVLRWLAETPREERGAGAVPAEADGKAAPRAGRKTRARRNATPQEATT